MTSRRSVLRSGGAAVALYVVAIIVTMRLTGHHVRPLFEGIGPAAPYHWVDPPPEFAAGNITPQPVEIEIQLDDTGSRAAGPATTDGQLVLAMPGGAIAPHPPDTTARARLTPLAPDTVGAVPSGLRADGNVYRVELAYQDSGTAVVSLAKPGNVILVVPEPATAILFSADGETWQSLETQQVGGAAATTVGARLDGPGYFLAAAPPAAPTEGPGGGGNDAGSVVAVAAITAVLALALGFGPALIRRVRR